MSKKKGRIRCDQKPTWHWNCKPEMPVWHCKEDWWEMPEWCQEEKMPKKHYQSEDRITKRDWDYDDDKMPERYWEDDKKEVRKKRHHPCPDDKGDFCQMVEDAIMDEIGAVSMYATMANLVDDPLLKALILSVAGDEYGHARFWLAVLALSEC